MPAGRETKCKAKVRNLPSQVRLHVHVLGKTSSLPSTELFGPATPGCIKRYMSCRANAVNKLLRRRITLEHTALSLACRVRGCDPRQRRAPDGAASKRALRGGRRGGHRRVEAPAATKAKHNWHVPDASADRATDTLAMSPTPSDDHVTNQPHINTCRAHIALAHESLLRRGTRSSAHECHNAC